jgi:hypothetical protein
MYEINLVPDVKAELLHKQKLRNLVILICIAAGIACVVVVVILAGIVATQAITIAAQDHEIKCRSDGDTNCNGTDTPVNKFDNLETLLTMKSQMQDISTLNGTQLNLSRIFSMFDVILPDSQQSGTVNVSMLDADFETMTFTINANSKNSIGFTAREAFAKGLKYAYYDYGTYKREEDGVFVDIPSYCIREEVENGILYGVYLKGKAGCEAPLITKSDEVPKISTIKEIRIRRTYKDEKDFDNYRQGTDSLAKKGEKTAAGSYYFESHCIKYKDGEFSEEETLQECALLDGDVVLEAGSYGRSDGNQMVLTFTANFVLSREAFLAQNKHMIFVGPTKRNVTDSYEPVRDIFSEEVTVVEEAKNGK